MTLDECAQWFYNAFYSEPAIRTKYEIQVRSCPLAIKKKLLQLPSVDSADSADTESSPGSDTEGVEVSVTKCGRFLFPVTFATFEQYIIQDMLLPCLVRKQTKDKAQRKEILADKSKCRHILQKYYNSFYIFPSKRKLNKYGLKEAPPSLRSQLLKEGIPLDEMAKKTVETFLIQFSGKPKSSEAVKPQDGISSIVSFAVFQKYVTNVHNIAWSLKMNEPEYACKGFDDCAFAYYLAFYLTPEIRDRYPYQLAPCTTAMRNRLLALPNEKDEEALLEMQRLNIHLPLSQELEIRSRPVEEQCRIAKVPEMECKELESESQELEVCSKPVEDKCEIVTDLEKSLECEMQELLSQEYDPAAKPVEEQCKIAKVPEMECEVLQPVVEGATNKQELMNEQSNETQPVTFVVFKRFIKNLDRIVEEMLCCEEYKGRSKDECALEYFKAFYATPQIREKFAYEIRPCPAKVRQKLLSIPEEIFISAERSSAATDADGNGNAIELPDKLTAPTQFRHDLMEMATAKDQQLPKEVPSTVSKTFTEQEHRGNEKQALTENHQPKTTVDISRDSKRNSGSKVVVLDERIIIPIENISYVFPVSVQTFQRFINYDTLKVELAKRFAKSNNVEKLLSNERSNSILLLRFYRSFYIDKSIRKKFNYNFDAAPVEMQQKLLQYAVPVGQFAMSTAPQSAIKIDSKTTQKPKQKDTPVASVAPEQPIVIVVPFAPVPPAAPLSAAVPVAPVAPEKPLAPVPPAAPLSAAVPVTLVAPEKPVAPAPPVVPVVPIAPVTSVAPLAPVASVPPVVPVEPVASPAVSVPDQKRHSPNDKQYPVTFRAFSNLLNLDDVVKQMQQEAHYAKMSAKECKLDYYKAFYRSPKIREKYTYVIKPCPSILKAKILEIPVIFDHNYSSCSPERDSESILADLYASRAAELSRMEWENVVEYVPHNLGSYIALRLQCPQKRLLLENHFMDRKRTKITTSKVAVPEEHTVTSVEQELNGVSKTSEVTATVVTTSPMKVVETTIKTSELVEKPALISKITESVVKATLDRTIPMEVVETTATTSEVMEKPASISKLTECVVKDTVDRTIPMEVVETTATTSEVIDKPASISETNEPVVKTTVDRTIPMEVVETTATTSEVVDKPASISKTTKPIVKTTVDRTIPMEVVETTATTSEVVDKPASISETTEPASAVGTVVAVKTKTAQPTASTTVNVVSTSSSESSEATKTAQPTASTKGNVVPPSKDIPSTSSSSEASKVATATDSTRGNVVSTSKDIPYTSSSSSEASKAATPNASTTGNVVSTSSSASSEATKAATATALTTLNVVSTSKDIPSTSSASSEATKAATPIASTTPGRAESTTINVVALPKDVPSTSSASNSGQRATESASVAAERAARSNKSVTESQTWTISLVSSRPTHTLSKLTKDFFTPNGKEHNLKYLIYTSHGLKKTIWHILSQLSFSEFKAYTGIYEGESLYTDESFLGRIYYHVIAKGNWPITLYVKFSMLSKLLKSKGVYIDKLDLGQLSPKIFCWRELSRFTNFDDIVECDYGDRTGCNVEDVPHLFTLVEQFYVLCWTHDQWIQHVPIITVENLNPSVDREDTKAANITTLPATICLIEYNANAPEVSIEILSEGTATTESVAADLADKQYDANCPPTQLEVSLDQHSFVDVENVCPASQVAQTQNDPLLQDSLSVPVRIKQEPVTFLTRMRFSINSEKNSEFICEPITTEELIINLDTEEDERKEEEELASQPIITEKEIINVDNDEDEQMSEELASQPSSKEDNDDDKRIELNVTSKIPIDDSQDILDEVMYEEKMASFNGLESSETPEQIEVEAAYTEETEIDQSPAQIQTSQVAPVEPGQPEMLVSQPISTENDNEDEPNVTSVIPLLSACDIEFYQDILDEARNKEQIAVANELVSSAASTEATQSEVVQKSAETQNNSILRSRLLSVPVETVPVEPESVQVQVKQEPVKFLTMMRFSMDSEQSDEFKCEPITTEEQIINLDTEEDDLACFNMTPPNVTPAIALLTHSEEEDFNALMNGARDEALQEISVHAAAPQVEVERNPVVLPAAARSVTVRKHQRGTVSTVPSKKPRLMADNVPQLRHDFRPLPLTAMIRIEGNLERREERSAEQELPTTLSQGQERGQMTASQDLALATDNTQLMESSQLQRLLDAPYVNQRQVNVVASDSDKNDRATTTQRIPPTVHIVFSTLERYMYFNSLTTANITKYQINSLSLGSSYQQALICANGKLCNVYGPLLENLFPHCTASLLKDLQCLLQDIGEFSYNSRVNAHRESREDLRTRVLYAFMRAAPPFAYIRLQFENETREWANCSSISERDSDFVIRKPSCDVISGLRPEILERMKEVKKKLSNP
ncbi:hypothetical protein ACLKA6_002531 [Drosophila palustris]